jgi:hypothetical protein
MSPNQREVWSVSGARSAIRADNPAAFIEQHTAPLLYRRTRPVDGEHRVFATEQEFWASSEGLPFASVCLAKFRLSDWFPRARGVYWSRYGQQIRENVYSTKPQHDPVLGLFYNPQSKMSLIEEGGIGTIRLSPRRIDDMDCWLATAVRGPQCAGGVPLAIPHSYIREAAVTWGETVKVYGTVRFLQDIGLEDTAASVHHASPLIIFVEKIEGVPKRQQLADPTIITPAVLFSGEDSSGARRNSRPEFGYTFIQCGATDTGELDEAGSWIESYAKKHGGRVITNFDERRPLFSDAPLSYQHLIKKTYDRTIIKHIHFKGAKLADRIDHVEQVMSVNVTLGDGTVIHGDLVIANSIKDSFNRVKESHASEDLKAALQKLSSQVGVLIKNLDSDSAQKAADDLETLTKEALREKPRRSWWELSLGGLKDAAKAVGDIGKPLIETVAAVAKLLASA